MPRIRYDIDETNCRESELLGFTIVVEACETRLQPLDREALREWCLMIARAVISGEFKHNLLIEEGVHIRIETNLGEVLVDTIAERSPRS